MRQIAQSIAVLLPALALACATSPSPRDNAEVVPLIALLATPEVFDGRKVSVTAWAALEFELAALFPSEAEQRNLVFASGIWLDAPEEAFSALSFPFYGFATVEGVFQAGDPARGFRGRIQVSHIVERNPTPQAM